MVSSKKETFLRAVQIRVDFTMLIMMRKVNIGPFSPESPECNLKGQTCVSVCVFVHVCV